MILGVIGYYEISRTLILYIDFSMGELTVSHNYIVKYVMKY